MTLLTALKCLRILFDKNLGSAKGGEYLGQLLDYQFLNMDTPSVNVATQSLFYPVIVKYLQYLNLFKIVHTGGSTIM